MARKARPVDDAGDDKTPPGGPPWLSGCARSLRALADPDRLRIVAHLYQGPCSVSDVASVLRKTLALASHHMRVLYRAGLVVPAREGRRQIYRLHPDVVRPNDSPWPMCFDLGCCRLSWPSLFSSRVDRTAGPPGRGTSPRTSKQNRRIILTRHLLMNSFNGRGRSA